MLCTLFPAHGTSCPSQAKAWGLSATNDVTKGLGYRFWWSGLAFLPSSAGLFRALGLCRIRDSRVWGSSFADIYIVGLFKDCFLFTTLNVMSVLVGSLDAREAADSFCFLGVAETLGVVHRWNRSSGRLSLSRHPQLPVSVTLWGLCCD